MDSEAATTDRIAPARRAVPACLLAMMLLAISLQVPGPGTGEEVGKAGRVDVLFHFTAEDYIWGEAVVNATLDAVSVSRDAAYGVNKAFVYETNASGTRVEIGGLAPPPGAWSWAVLKWGKNNSWEEWKGSATDLAVAPGEAIAWCPGDQIPPTPDPLSKYPWPMFRSSASRRGESLSPPPLTNLTWWTAHVNGSVFTSPCVANGKVFILNFTVDPQRSSSLYCLNEYTGREEWKADLPGTGYQLSSPAFADGKVFVVGSDSNLLALNARDGSVLWTFGTGQASQPLGSSVAVWRGMLLLGGKDGFLYSVTMDGRLDWKTNLGSPDLPIASSPAVTGDKVVIGNDTGCVFCLYVTNGSIIWKVDLDGQMVATPALSSEGYAFIEVLHGRETDNPTMVLYSINLRDGVVQWSASYPVSISSPALAEGGLYFGTFTELVGHHPDRGTKVWGIPYGPIASSPAVANGYVYFTTYMSGIVGCVRVGGNVEWSLTLNESFISSPALADGRLFTVGVNGTVYCLGRPPSPFVQAILSAPAKASGGAIVKVKAMLNNTGEAPAAFSAMLTVDNKTTDIRTGPVTLQPGQRRELTFDWTAKEGDHALGIVFNGTNGTSRSVNLKVGPASSACVVSWVIPVAACAVSVPLVVKWDRREQR